MDRFPVCWRTEILFAITPLFSKNTRITKQFVERNNAYVFLISGILLMYNHEVGIIHDRCILWIWSVQSTVPIEAQHTLRCKLFCAWFRVLAKYCWQIDTRKQSVYLLPYSALLVSRSLLDASNIRVQRIFPFMLRKSKYERWNWFTLQDLVRIAFIVSTV